MKQESIALIGLSGSGKSTVGRLLAEQSGLPLHDTDALIVARAGQSIPEIFAAHGETGFRDRESEALRITLNEGASVIATGGGIVLRPENRELLRRYAFVVWLDAPPEALHARLTAHDEERPLLAGDDMLPRLIAQRAARAHLYHELAHLQINTHEQHAQEIATHILRSRQIMLA